MRKKIEKPPDKTEDEVAMALALDWSPDNWELRGIYADWLEENGRDGEAQGQRWMISHRRRPLRSSLTWWWFDEKNQHTTAGDPVSPDTPYEDLDDPESDVPHDIYRKMCGRIIAHSVQSESRVTAEHRLFQAMGLL